MGSSVLACEYTSLGAALSLPDVDLSILMNTTSMMTIESNIKAGEITIKIFKPFDFYKCS